MVDEGVPHGLLKLLQTQDLTTPPFQKSWKAMQDRDLLPRVEAMGVSILITREKNIAFQQNGRNRSFGFVALPTTTLADLKPIAAEIVASLHQAEPGPIIMLDRAGRMSFPAS